MDEQNQKVFSSIKNTFKEKMEESVTDNEAQCFQSYQTGQSQNVMLQSIYLMKQENQQYYNQQSRIPKSYIFKEACVRELGVSQPPQNIYMMQEYLQKFSCPSLTKEILSKYQSEYKVIQRPKSAKKTSDLMNFLLLKSISLMPDKLQNSINAVDFINKYKLRKINCQQYQRIEHRSPQLQFTNLQHQQQQSASSSSPLSGTNILSNVTFKLKQIEQWTSEIIGLSEIPTEDLYLQISKQFLLFITSNYKILKQASSDDKGAQAIKRVSSKQIKNSNKDDTFQFIQQFLQTTTSNYVNEFIQYKNQTDSQRQTRKNSNESFDHQGNSNFDEEGFDQEKCNDNENLMKKNDSFMQKIQSTSQSNDGQSACQKNFGEEKQELLGKNMYCMQNKNLGPFQARSSKLDLQKSREGKDSEGNGLEEEEGSQLEEEEDEDEEQKQFQKNSGKNSSNSKTNKKKRTNNFYNMPRYFMMLILELLSTKNLHDIGLQDGFVQIISRISLNLRQQGKKSDQAKSNFYNHQHYNCLFQILLEDRIPEMNITNCNNASMSSLQSTEQYTNKLPQQMEELYKKVFEVSDTQSQYNQTYINCFKCIISQIVKYQLRIMQDLQLTQYILMHAKDFPFEKSKINYITRVVSGIEKLNGGQNIHRF